MSYPQIEKLQKLLKDFDISIHIRNGDLLSGEESYKGADIIIGGDIFKLYLYDEYNDLRETNQAMGLCLALRELEEYISADDFMTWCKIQGLNPSVGDTRDYHMELRTIYMKIEEIIGKVDSQISDLEFQLNSGAAQKLRNIG